VVAAEALAEQTAVLAGRLEGSAPMAMAHLKQLIRQADRNDLHTQLALEARLFRQCAATADFTEGMAAFAEKRPARFEGL
jgi:2-(1,2-epoxy-1,2-dihydrophenyl)acetyl-CoA isomerase